MTTSGTSGGAGTASDLVSAAAVIMLADATMSLDNVVALAAIAGGDFWLLALGVLFSIPDHRLWRPHPERAHPSRARNHCCRRRVSRLDRRSNGRIRPARRELGPGERAGARRFSPPPSSPSSCCVGGVRRRLRERSARRAARRSSRPHARRAARVVRDPDRRSATTPDANLDRQPSCVRRAARGSSAGFRRRRACRIGARMDGGAGRRRRVRPACVSRRPDHLHRLVLRQPDVRLPACFPAEKETMTQEHIDSRAAAGAEAQRAPSPARRLDVLRRGDDAERHRRRARRRPGDGRPHARRGQGARRGAHRAFARTRGARRSGGGAVQDARARGGDGRSAVGAGCRSDRTDRRGARRLCLLDPAQRHEDRPRLGPHPEPLARVPARAFSARPQRRLAGRRRDPFRARQSGRVPFRLRPRLQRRLLSHSGASARRRALRPRPR